MRDRHPPGNCEQRTQFEADRRFDQLFPLYFASGVLLAFVITVLVIIVMVDGGLPDWLAAFWFRN